MRVSGICHPFTRRRGIHPHVPAREHVKWGASAAPAASQPTSGSRMNKISFPLKPAIARLELYAGDVGRHNVASAALADPAQQAFTFKAAADQPGPTQVLTRDPEGGAFLLIRYTLA